MLKHTKKFMLLPATILLGSSLVFGGCTAAKKPMPPAQQAPAGQNNITAPKNTAQNQNYPRDVVDRVVKEANKVEGVRGSSAVVSGRNIYLGLDLNANLEKNRSAQVERNVLAQVKKVEPNYTVMVSSDVDIVTRIKRVGQGISQGKPISSFTKELEDIGTRIKPRTK